MYGLAQKTQISVLLKILKAAITKNKMIGYLTAIYTMHLD